MGRLEEYREFAKRCVEVARSTADAQTRVVMLQMAQVWSRLADAIENAGQRPEQGSAAKGDEDDSR